MGHLWKLKCGLQLRGLALARLEFCCAVDCLADALVGSAAADVPAHEIVNFGIARTGLFSEQRCSRHDLPALAVTTLRHIDFHPGALHWMAAIGRKPFNCGDFLSRNGRDWRDAGPCRFTINMHGTRAA